MSADEVRDGIGDGVVRPCLSKSRIHGPNIVWLQKINSSHNADNQTTMLRLRVNSIIESKRTEATVHASFPQYKTLAGISPEFQLKSCIPRS